ncbi:MAG TPA: PP2C family protein-serine/threonine phosphatase [Tepidisphaeraceae bacterium]|nr:PP2C family protein-serine/threonine phosphatase [Tepidisphaeraceae bacterium]
MLELNTKHFATRTVVSHVLLLVVVIAVVAVATRSVYNSAREQAISQALGQQESLARQTARGIQSFYASILSDLDLIRLAEQHAGPGGAAAEISATLWDKLQGRVTHLFAYDRATDTVTWRFGDEDQISAERLIDASQEWLARVKGPDVSGFLPFRDGLNLAAVPVEGPQRRVLVAVVPLRVIQTQFLTDVNNRDAMSAMLLDEGAKVMASPSGSMIGKSFVDDATDPRVRAIAREYIGQGKSGTEAFDDDVTVGDTVLTRAITSIRPIELPEKKWWLVMSSGLNEVDRIVNTLFRKAVFFGIFVVASVTAILVSTSTQLIRSRARLERVKHELLTKELDQARAIQLAWLPEKHCKMRMIDIAAVNHPASHISGDFYNWFELPGGRTCITIGDVTGHGIAAAFLMATTQLMVRTVMTRVGDPGKCLEEVNHHLSVQVFNGQFVTMLILVIDLERNELLVASAGHAGPLVSDGHRFEPLPVQAQLVLGVEEEVSFPTQRFPMSGISSMLLYTDGAIDVQNTRGERFSEKHLQRSLYGRFDHAEDLLDAAVDAVNGFRDGRELSDDLTFVAIHLERAAAPREPVEATA